MQTVQQTRYIDARGGIHDTQVEALRSDLDALTLYLGLENDPRRHILQALQNYPTLAEIKAAHDCLDREFDRLRSLRAIVKQLEG